MSSTYSSSNQPPNTQDSSSTYQSHNCVRKLKTIFTKVKKAAKKSKAERQKKEGIKLELSTQFWLNRICGRIVLIHVLKKWLLFYLFFSRGEGQSSENYLNYLSYGRHKIFLRLFLVFNHWPSQVTKSI